MHYRIIEIVLDWKPVTHQISSYGEGSIHTYGTMLVEHWYCAIQLPSICSWGMELLQAENHRSCLRSPFLQWNTKSSTSCTPGPDHMADALQFPDAGAHGSSRNTWTCGCWSLEVDLSDSVYLLGAIHSRFPLSGGFLAPKTTKSNSPIQPTNHNSKIWIDLVNSWMVQKTRLP